MQGANAHAAHPGQFLRGERLVDVHLHVLDHRREPGSRHRVRGAGQFVGVGAGHRGQQLGEHECLQLFPGHRHLGQAARPVELAGHELHRGQQAAPRPGGQVEAEVEVDHVIDAAADQVGQVRLEPPARHLQDQLLGVGGPPDPVLLIGEQDQAAGPAGGHGPAAVAPVGERLAPGGQVDVVADLGRGHVEPGLGAVDQEPDGEPRRLRGVQRHPEPVTVGAVQAVRQVDPGDGVPGRVQLGGADNRELAKGLDLDAAVLVHEPPPGT